MNKATTSDSSIIKGTSSRHIDRRTFLLAASSLACAAGAASLFWEYEESYLRASVFIGAARSYELDLERILLEGLRELGLSREWARGKSVLLKPNLVESSRRAPHINTHPAVVAAVAEVFRRWDAREVFVAEGPGHTRDCYVELEESGLWQVLTSARIPFVDLNHDEVITRKNQLRRTSLRQLYLPKSLLRADLIVSLPKMKTHHWAGVTLSMKNLFGILPGICYGWPKNVLHTVGIPESILDINATVQPHLAIIDGIIGMEGDGPLMGPPKASGVLIMGTNFPAVDATATRLMGLNPRRIQYLTSASGVLGPIAESHIQQRGEPIGPFVKPYRPAPGT